MTKCGGILTGPWTAAERARGERVGMVESVKGAHQAARPRPLARAPQGAVQLGGQRRAPEQASQWYADRGGSWARRAPTQWPVAPSGLPATAASDGTGAACLGPSRFRDL